MRRSPTNPSAQPPATHRFREVLAHIDAHLDDDLSVARLSRVARASAFHFHHLFSTHFGLGVHRYVQLARLRRAAYQLVYRHQLRVVDVALASGYESPEAFARVFKRVIGHTPSAFRARPDWSTWIGLDARIAALRAQETAGDEPHVVTIACRPAIRVAALEVRGQPVRLREALQRFIAWRVANGLSPARSATYSVFHDPGSRTAIDLCAATHRPVLPNALGVVERWLPAGRGAVVRHVGRHGALLAAARWLHACWLPASGEAPREAPLVIHRVSLFPDVPEHEAESEIFLPLM